jgi:hypothetical protein
MIDKFPMAAAAGSEFLSIKLLEKRAPGGEILPALLIRDLPIAHPFGLPVHPTVSPHVVLSLGNGNCCGHRRIACERFRESQPRKLSGLPLQKI